ncbi:MAG: sulfate adenylyltransferase subunit CysN [Bacteroidaceae bacterium]|nr:sulfate adenylyltransferase subunit CysN [Bacteroidaceae bacterium]
MTTPTLNIKEFLDQDEKKDLLRLLTAGSVDDGKSTLIGRLLFDSKKLYEDQLVALERDSKRVGNAGENNIDYALLLDGLKAEREQGITIDVAYRYFSTNKRKFIIADTPGHEQYTRNMITGGSTANLAIILVDARTGVITQTKRHSYLISLLGIKHVVLAVNKMDLVDYSQSVFDKIVDDYKTFVAPFNIPDIQCIPLSALKGDNVVELSENMDWYTGMPLLGFLETVHVASDQNFENFRYPVQYVSRPNLDFRGFCGKIASGIVQKGDEVVALPSGKKSRVKSIYTYDGELVKAFPPQSVTLTLEDEIDVSRGEMLVHPSDLPRIGRNFEAMLVWMDEKTMDAGQQYYLKHTTNTTRAHIDSVRYKVDVNTLRQSAADVLALNEIGRVTLATNKPLFFDPYKDNKNCGAFILIDPITNNTCAVGMIIDKINSKDIASNITDDVRKKMSEGISAVSMEEKAKRLDQEGCVFSIAGNSAEAKREYAYMLERRLTDIGRTVAVIDAVALQLDSDICDRIGRTLRMQGLVVICITCDGAGNDDNLVVITQERNKGSMISISTERNKISSAVEDVVNKIVQ